MTAGARSKLAVILHADVVSSTALVQKDERLAHDRIQDVFRRFSEIITVYGGTTHELRGDALLAAFNRASDAVSAALAFQANNAEHNTALVKQVPATEIKIDKTFIEIISVDKTDQHIVKAVIDIAHALGMQVVAEGVDSDESLAMILELGCEMAQGYLIARPMRGDLVRKWVEDYSPALSLDEDAIPAADLLSLEA